jgi:hypothetical protein
MNVDKLKDKLLKGTFFYYKNSLYVKGDIYNVVSYDDVELEIFFKGGIVGVYKDKLKTIRRPGNIIEKFDWCYILKDEYDECIGYIGKIEEIA